MCQLQVIRPNHSLRTQIVEFREQYDLPALPAWSPDPQETVEPPPGPPATQSVSGSVQLQIGGVPGGMQVVSSPLGGVAVLLCAALLFRLHPCGAVVQYGCAVLWMLNIV